MNKYDAQFFIDFFSKIPERKWTTFKFTDKVRGLFGPYYQHCALGFCYYKGVKIQKYNWESLPVDRNREMADALMNLAIKGFGGCVPTITSINDGFTYKFRQKTPKKRILAALKEFKEKGL
jgi:hypothetical protein